MGLYIDDKNYHVTWMKNISVSQFNLGNVIIWKAEWELEQTNFDTFDQSLWQEKICNNFHISIFKYKSSDWMLFPTWIDDLICISF